MGNFQSNKDQVKVTKYGRSISNISDERQRTDIKVDYQGNHILNKSVIKINTSSYSPQRQNITTSLKNSKLLHSEINTDNSKIEIRAKRVETEYDKSNIDMNLSKQSGSRMQKSFRQMKDEEIRQNKIAKRLQRQKNIQNNNLDKIQSVKQTHNFMTQLFEINQVDMIPMDNFANYCTLEGETINENFEYKLINYPKHKYRSDIKMHNQMMQFQNINQNRKEQKVDNNLQTVGAQKLISNEIKNTRNQDFEINTKHVENVGQLIKEKQELINSLKQQDQKQQQQYMPLNINNKNDNFLTISKMLQDKQQQHLEMDNNRFARPVTSLLYPGGVSESQIKQHHQQYQHHLGQQIVNENEENLVYLGNPMHVTSKISQNERDENFTIQNNISNISVDSNILQKQKQMNTTNNSGIKGDFIKIEQYNSISSTSTPNKNKSIHEMLHNRKTSQNIMNQSQIEKQQLQKQDQISMLKSLQSQQSLNKNKDNGENTFGFQRFRSHSETNIINKNFQNAVDYFDKSISNTKNYQKQLQEQNQNISSRVISRESEQNKQLLIKQNSSKVENTPKFRISSGLNNMALSGKFSLNSQSMSQIERTQSNIDNQNSKGNINPNLNLNKVLTEQRMLNLSQGGIQNNEVIQQQIQINQQENIEAPKKIFECSETQTNNSLRYSSHLGYLTSLHQMRQVKSGSPSFRHYFQPQIIGTSSTQSYYDLIHKMKNYYNQQSKFLFDSITNKKYDEYQKPGQYSQINKVTKQKKPKRILQISSKPKNKQQANTYSKIHSKQHQDENLIRQQNNYHPLTNIKSLSNISNYQNMSQSAQINNYQVSNQRYVNSSNYMSNSSPIIKSRQNQERIYTNTKRSPSSSKKRSASTSQNKSPQIQLKRSTSVIQKSSPQIQYLRSQQYLDQRLPQNKSLRSLSNEQQKQMLASQQRSPQNNKQRSIFASQKLSKSTMSGKQNQKKTSFSPQRKEQTHFSSNYDFEVNDDGENIYHQDSNMLNISSNTTTDIQTPIQISLGVSQFKKKSENNSIVKDMYSSQRQKSPLKNKILTQSQSKEIGAFYQISPILKQNNSIIQQNGYNNNIVDEQLGRIQMIQQNKQFQLYQDSNYNSEQKHRQQIHNQEVNDQYNDYQNNEEEFVEKYINQSTGKNNKIKYSHQNISKEQIHNINYY